jgi:protein-disulfide isomerase
MQSANRLNNKSTNSRSQNKRKPMRKPRTPSKIKLGIIIGCVLITILILVGAIWGSSIYDSWFPQDSSASSSSTDSGSGSAPDENSFSSSESPIDSQALDPVSQLGDVLNPKNSTGDGGIAISPDGSTLTALLDNVPTVEVVLDPICPGCAQVERAYGDYLKKMTTEGKINYIVKPVALMDTGESAFAEDKYSTRATAAIAYVATEATDKLMDFIQVLFAEGNQPPEAGYEPVPDSFFVERAIEAGVDKQLAEGILKQDFMPWAGVVTQIFLSDSKYQENGVVSTPQIRVNGNRIEANELEQTIDGA